MLKFSELKMQADPWTILNLTDQKRTKLNTVQGKQIKKIAGKKLKH